MSGNFFDEDWSAKVTLPMKRVGDRWEFFYGGDVPVKDGAIADLTVNTCDLTDDKFRQRVTQEALVRILPEGAELCVALSDRSENSRRRLGNWPDKYPVALPPGTTRIERIWLGPPKKKKPEPQTKLEGVPEADDSQGGLWLKVKGLARCELHGSTVKLPEGFDPVTAVSLNHAFTKLSECYEAHRLSHTGNVYERIFYQDRNGLWYPLDDLRRGVLVGAERALMVDVWQQVETLLGWRPPPPQPKPVRKK